MKYNTVFLDIIKCSNPLEIFQYLQNTLAESITSWEYFVNWAKVLRNFRNIEVNLNILNFLIGKDNPEEELHYLIQEYPKLASTIPILLACRESNFKILTSYLQGDLIYENFNFSKINQLHEDEIHKIIELVQKTGILELFKNKIIKSVPDYVLGIEVGLDSNGRKNRSGTTMETMVEVHLKKICQDHNLLIMIQATSLKLAQQWGVQIKMDKSTRRFDFAIKNENTLYLIETNFYGGGGSKLKATAGEYKGLFYFISLQGHKFIWITDGLGWKTALRSLEETFNYIDYTFNLNMVAAGLLTEVILQKL